MKQDRSDRVFMYLSIGGFVLMSVSFLLMPIESMRILPGMFFWGGLFIGAVFQIILEARRRAFFKKYNVQRKRMQKPRNGFLTFGSNHVAVIADYVLAAGAIAMIPAFFLTKGSGYLCYVCIAIVQLSFCLHCIFNGRNFFHVNNKKKVRQVLEQKKATTMDKGEGDNDKE